MAVDVLLKGITGRHRVTNRNETAKRKITDLIGEYEPLGVALRRKLQLFGQVRLHRIRGCHMVWWRVKGGDEGNKELGSVWTVNGITCMSMRN